MAAAIKSLKQLTKPTLPDSVVFLTAQHSGTSRSKRRPLLICFHGSGTSNADSWKEMIEILHSSYQVLFVERLSTRTTAEEHANALVLYLRGHDLLPPYILVAHSYGGVFAKQFLKDYPKLVAGIVLVETGKSADKVNMVEEYIARRGLLAGKPLSVIRGNSFLRHQAELDARILRASRTAEAVSNLHEQQQWLATALSHDEKLERSQLLLSLNHRFVHLPDCGHNVVRDRPDIVAQEIDWTHANMVTEKQALSYTSRLWHFLCGSKLLVGGSVEQCAASSLHSA